MLRQGCVHVNLDNTHKNFHLYNNYLVNCEVKKAVIRQYLKMKVDYISVKFYYAISTRLLRRMFVEIRIFPLFIVFIMAYYNIRSQ